MPKALNNAVCWVRKWVQTDPATPAAGQEIHMSVALHLNQHVNASSRAVSAYRIMDCTDNATNTKEKMRRRPSYFLAKVICKENAQHMLLETKT